ncbi:MAG TPA: FAD-binding oxidoreductase [Syntrophomonadaceae bacterium]|nr:FAD-binding oxidoreductase [Syntrophomonadaceae bacterium]HOQ10204.1 FAD-binding oxidoreductase [Syntrophomonadaceae bacterium]HPU49331.1 FAD-binding oxidoreductase [Syntrophomonadaceae bacterium]
MKPEIVEEIKHKYGDRANDSPFERNLYTRDLAPVPALMVDPLFKTMPDLVVRPANEEEVAEILRIAWKENIPVTPRAGASTTYFDSIPVKGGIVMDLNLLRGVVGLNEERMTVTVQAGTTWSELDDYLKRRGLTEKSYPSSAPVATIGGWFCMMGYGIGSLKYGSLLSQVKSAQVVLATGDTIAVTPDTDPPLSWFAGSEGTLGIVTWLELEVRKLNPMKHFLLKMDSVPEMAQVLKEVKDAPVIPYNLHFTDPACVQGMHALGLIPDEVGEGCLLQVDYEGAEQELDQAEDIIRRIVDQHPKVKMMPGEMADLEWEERFKALRLKRGGPSVLGGEVWLPIKEVSGYLADIAAMSSKYGIRFMSYGHVVTPEYVTVMTMFYANEVNTINYMFSLGLTKKIQDVGFRYGGHPYGIGLWNSPYITRIYSRKELAELRERKKRLDPRGILNPGKVYRYPLLFHPFTFGIGANVMAGLIRAAGRGGRR